MIKARSKWKVVYPRFKEDPRYLNMLGNPGSNPLELFWDVVDELDQKLDVKMSSVEEDIKRYNTEVEERKENGKQAFVFGANTTENEFRNIIKADNHLELKSLTDEDIQEVFDVVSRSSRSGRLILMERIRCYPIQLKSKNMKS